MMKSWWIDPTHGATSKDLRCGEAASRLAQEDGQAILVADMIQWLGHKLQKGCNKIWTLLLMVQKSG